MSIDNQPMARALRLARSAVRLKPVQVYGRFLSPPGKPLSPNSISNIPHWKGLPPLSDTCKRCLAYGQNTDELTAGRFSFLSREAAFPGEINWSTPGTERLWRYHLHYLDWALALALDGRPQCLAVLDERITEWLEKNLPGIGDGWEPYPLSLRIVNLAYILSLPGAVSNRLAEMVKTSLAIQARALTRGIERTLQGNHLIKNGKALLAAGLAYRGSEAEAWLRSGLALLEREMKTQVHQDGGHADRCAMYQAQVLLDYLESAALLRAAGRPVPNEWHQRLQAMVVYLDALHHPDGLPTLLGDTSISCLPPNEQLRKLAHELGVKPALLAGCGSHEFPDSAYVMARDLQRGNYLILDSGAKGDALEAAHHHCQLFSYELSLGGRRVVTDTGTLTYEAGPDRAYCRGSAAHNSVSWAGREQSEIWGAFRLARRARILHREVSCTSNGALRFEGRMKGFYPGRARGYWERKIDWKPDGRLDVSDTWLGPNLAQGVVSRVHFAPGLRLTDVGNGKWSVSLLNQGARIAFLQVRQGTGALKRTPYHPSFGERYERDCLEVALVKNFARYQIEMVPTQA